MDEALAKIMFMLKPYSGYPHVLIPRSGRCIVHALKSLEARSFSLWRYNDDPSSEFDKPWLSLPVEMPTSFVLADHWRNEAFGAFFPELLYLPDDTAEVEFRRLTEVFRLRQTGAITAARFVKRVKNILTRLEWVITPMRVEPFLGDEPTYYCLVIAQNAKQLRQLATLMLKLNIRTFQLDATSDAWPIPEECEMEAEDLWDRELKGGD